LTFQIRQNYPAPVEFFAGAGFLPDFEKVPDSGYSPTLHYVKLERMLHVDYPVVI